jgi:prepilin-type N-terminal cleavage/methylation domain-containing protein
MLRLKKKASKKYLGYFSNKKIKAHGFTMVEIIVALAILSTSMLAVFSVLMMCTAANNGSQRLTEAVLLAEKLMSDVVLEKNITYQTTQGSGDAFTWQIQIAPTEIDNLAAICVNIRWLQQQKPQEYELLSLMHIPAMLEGK